MNNIKTVEYLWKPKGLKITREYGRAVAMVKNTATP
jgi:hypothetical protein